MQQAIVIGEGFIGLELVENLVRRGVQTTVVELQDTTQLLQGNGIPLPQLSFRVRADFQIHTGSDLRFACLSGRFEESVRDLLIQVGW